MTQSLESANKGLDHPAPFGLPEQPVKRPAPCPGPSVPDESTEQGLKIHWVVDHHANSPELVTRYNPVTGEKYLADPRDGKPRSRPRLGVIWSTADNGPSPQRTGVSTRIVNRGIREGWIKVIESRVEIRPAGPANDRFQKQHYFLQGDVLVVECLDEILHYEIIRPPSQWIDPLTGNVLTTWDYKLKLIKRITKNVVPEIAPLT